MPEVSMVDLQYVAESEAIIHFDGIGRRLGVSEAVIREAGETYPLCTDGAPSRRLMFILKNWFNGNGCIAGKHVKVTLPVLCEVLKETGCRNVSEVLKKLCKPISTLPYI